MAGDDGKASSDAGGKNDSKNAPIEEVYSPEKSESVRSILLRKDARTDPKMIEYVEKLFEKEIVGHHRVRRLVNMLISEIETDKIRKQIEDAVKAKESSDQKAKSPNEKKKRKKPATRRYHMCLSGPDNIGKYLMGTLIARILRRMGVVKKRMFVHLRNTTFQKFVHLCELAKGGVIYVDDAHSLIGDASDKASIDKMEEILRKNECMVIFSGKIQPMKDFFAKLPSISDMVPYKHFTFSELSRPELVEVFGLIAKRRHQILQEGALKAVRVMIKQIPKEDIKNDGCRCLTRLLEMAQKIRDARLSQLVAEDRPQLLRIILVQDIKRAMMVEGFKFEVEDQRTVQEMLDEEFAKIVGLEKIKDQLRKFAATAERAKLREEQLGITSGHKERLHMIFSGPPGCGKTMMANMVARILVKLEAVPSPKVTVVKKGADLCASQANASQARVDGIVSGSKGGVVFVDEAYTLTDAKAGTGKEAIESIMKHMDPPQCVFILAGYQVPMDEFLLQNEGLKRRVPYRFEFKPYTHDELMKIVKIYAKSQKLTLDEQEAKGVLSQLKSMGKKTIESRNASLAISWVQGARREIDSRVSFEEASENPQMLLELKAVDFEKAAVALRLRPDLDSDGLTVDQFLDKEFKKIIGHDKIKEHIRKIARRVARDRIMAEQGLLGAKKQGKYHMVFCGNPGTGKSFIAKLVAKMLLRLGVVESDRIVTVPTGNALIDKHMGGTPEKVRGKVREAQGGVLMIDEAYTITQELGPNAGSNVGAYGKQAVDTLMEFMSPPQLVMIFAGYEEEMNDFMRTNAGLARRIPNIFRFEDYSIDQLVEIFKVMCAAKKLTYDEDVPKELTKSLGFVPPDELSVRNAGAISDIVDKGQDNLSARIGLEEMRKNPKSMLHLKSDDVRKAMISLGYIRDLTGGGDGKGGKGETVEQLMEREFNKIVGHENIKRMLRKFAKKIVADRKRADIAGKADKRMHKDRYHMVFAGPPGTGKTMWAKVVAKILVKMGICPHDEVSVVSSPLNLLAGFQGQTPAKVDHRVQQARGGVLFIDEAYQLMTRSQAGGQAEASSYAKEAIDTLMKHMDPPKCVMIFAGYEHPMEEFLRANEGIARRLYDKFIFRPYKKPELLEIFKIMLRVNGEKLHDEEKSLREVTKMLESVPESYTKDKNGGFVENWIQNARLARDELLDIKEMEDDPSCLTMLKPQHLKIGLSSLKLRIEIDEASDEQLDGWLTKELKKVVGCRSIKEQIWKFRRQVAKDRIRRQRGKKIKGGELYHMIFSGPPGTGKTMIGKLMAKVMLKMGLVSQDRFFQVKNPQEMIDKYQGGTPHRVDHMVDQAKGGVMFIDEAYSLSMGRGGDYYANQAINQIMAHLDPPSAVFIFAGYEAPMKQFLGMNPGLERRIPYHYHFAPYSAEDLIDILKIQAKLAGKTIDEAAFAGIRAILRTIPKDKLKNENGGLTGRWLRFAAQNCDFRVPLNAARKNPDLLDKLLLQDFEATKSKLLPHKVRHDWEQGENAADHKGGSAGNNASSGDAKTVEGRVLAAGEWKGKEPHDIRDDIKKTFEDAFNLIDDNGNGYITPDELMKHYDKIRSLGFGSELEKDMHQDVLADFTRMDTDKDFRVSCQEYLDFFVQRGHIATDRADWLKKEGKLRKSLGLAPIVRPPEVEGLDGEDDIYG